jgi:hypothetical protein
MRIFLTNRRIFTGKYLQENIYREYMVTMENIYREYMVTMENIYWKNMEYAIVKKAPLIW